MKWHPHDYQRFALDFLLSHPVAALILDMGLGKTSVTLTAISELLYNRFEVHKVLVVAPLRVARSTWPEELRRWDHLRHIRYSVVTGTPAERRAALLKPADVYILNRENLSWLMEQHGLPLNFDMAVLDELSSFKNPSAQRTRAFLKLRPRLKRVVGLTGTPASNGLMDLFGEYRCLDMGERLGRSITRYREAYFAPDRRCGNVVWSYRPLPGAEDRITAKIRDITLSMRALDHLPMPALIENDVRVELSPEEREVYDVLRKDLVLPEEGVTAVSASGLASKLLQLSSGFLYTDSGDAIELHRRKLEALEDLIESAGSPVLVCYWFRHDLTRLSQFMERLSLPYAVLDTEDSIHSWNSGELKVGLIHPASAGHGLNLQYGGHHMIWYGLPWSLELYEQCVARLWRQGQSSRTVIVTRILTANTIDERVLKALASKATTQNDLIDAVKSEIGRKE